MSQSFSTPPAHPRPTFLPATAVGARKFLIAYNINLLGTKEQANRIAFNVREKGRGPDKPGRFKNVAGIGWYVEEYGMSQISVNCTDFDITNIHTVFESCKEDAESMNLAVCGSELVGLVPLECFLDIADYYIKKENLFIVSEAQKVTLVINRLGLNSVSPFVPSERIIDYKCKEEDPPLISMTVKGFVEILGARTAAPGGGSASALVAAMGAGLGAMMGWMTYGSVKVRRKRKCGSRGAGRVCSIICSFVACAPHFHFSHHHHHPLLTEKLVTKTSSQFQDLDSEMRKAIMPLHNVMTTLITRIDADTDAFNDYMVAMRLPKVTDEDKIAREAAMQEGLKVAIDVPLETMKVANVCWASMLKLADVGNINSKSDLQVGARCLELGIWGCWKNVEINLKDINDESYERKTAAEAKEIWEEADAMCKKVLEAIEKR